MNPVSGVDNLLGNGVLGHSSPSLVSRQDGRVGERATPCGATHSPLVEPDKRISRHPALLKLSPQACAGSCAAARLISAPAQSDLLVIADSFRRTEGPLAAPSQMLHETVPNVRVALSEGYARTIKMCE